MVFVASVSSDTKNEPYVFPELTFFPPMPSATDNPVTIQGAELGRHLFYDTILSATRNMSCASCHKQQYAFSDGPQAFSKGRNGVLQKRNTLPLFNLAWHKTMFWDGRAASIEAQILHPVRDSNELNLNWAAATQRVQQNRWYRKQFSKVFGTSQIDSTHICKAIGQFLRTMLSHQSKYDQVLMGTASFTKDEYEGFMLLNDQTKGDCLHCHTTDSDPLGSTFAFSNNGLDAIANPSDFLDKGRGNITGRATDNGKFKIPTLRNLSFTAPYMHDGRFKTIEEVVDFYSEGVKPSATIDSKMEFAHQGGARLSAEEKRKIIAFLLTLSDSSFVKDAAYTSPYE
jgi:cytochrome c peroxidase